MSLVWASIANIATTAVLATLSRPKESFILPSLKNCKDILSFCGKTSLTSIISEIGRNTGDLVIGKYLGLANVAIYSKAQTLNSMFSFNIIGAIHNVYYPLISKHHRENQDISHSFTQATTYITVLSFPFFAFLALKSESIIYIIFGNQWMAVTPIIQILTIAGSIYSIWGLSPKTLYALKKAKIVLKSEILIQTTRVTLIIIAAFYSLELIAWAQVITYAIGLFVYFIYLKRYIDISIKRIFLSSIIHSLSVCLFSLSIPLYNEYNSIYYSDTKLIDLAITSFITLLSWFLSILALSHPIKEQIINTIKK